MQFERHLRKLGHRQSLSHSRLRSRLSDDAPPHRQKRRVDEIDKVYLYAAVAGRSGTLRSQSGPSNDRGRTASLFSGGFAVELSLSKMGHVHLCHSGDGGGDWGVASVRHSSQPLSADSDQSDSHVSHLPQQQLHRRQPHPPLLSDTGRPDPRPQGQDTVGEGDLEITGVSEGGESDSLWSFAVSPFGGVLRATGPRRLRLLSATFCQGVVPGVSDCQLAGYFGRPRPHCLSGWLRNIGQELVGPAAARGDTVPVGQGVVRPAVCGSVPPADYLLRSRDLSGLIRLDALWSADRGAGLPRAAPLQQTLR